MAMERNDTLGHVVKQVESMLDDQLDLRRHTTQIRKPSLVAIVLDSENVANNIKKTGRFFRVWSRQKIRSGVPRNQVRFLKRVDFSNTTDESRRTVYVFSDLRQTFMPDETVLHNADVVFESDAEHFVQNEDLYEKIGVRVVVLEKIQNEETLNSNLKSYKKYAITDSFSYWRHNSLERIYKINQDSISEISMSDLRTHLDVNFDTINTPLTLEELLSTGMQMPYDRKLNHLAKKNGQGKLFVDTMLSILAAARHLVNNKKAENMSQAVSMLVLVYLGAGQPNPNPSTHHLATVLRFFPDLHVIMYDTNSMDFELDKYLVYKGVEVCVKDEKGKQIYEGRVVGNLKNGHVRVKIQKSIQNARNFDTPKGEIRVDIHRVELKRVDKRYKMITHHGARELVNDLKNIQKFAVVVSDIRSGVEGPIQENDCVRKHIEKICDGDESSGDMSTDIERITKLKQHDQLLEKARAEMVYNDMIFQMQIMEILEQSGWLVYSSLKVATDYQDLTDDQKKVYLPKDMLLMIQSFIPSTEMRALKFYIIVAIKKIFTRAKDLAVSKTKSDDALTMKATEYMFTPEAPSKAAYYVKTVLQDFSKPKPKHYDESEFEENFEVRDGKLFFKANATKKPDHRNQSLCIHGEYYRPCFEQESNNKLQEFSAQSVDNALMYMHSIDRTHTGCNNASIRLMLKLFAEYRPSKKTKKEIEDFLSLLHSHAVQHAIPHIRHDEIDRYLMSSDVKTDNLQIRITGKAPAVSYLEQSVKFYTENLTKPDKVLDTREAFLDIILNAVQMNALGLTRAFANINANEQNLQLLARIWLHVHDQFRFYTHACYTDIKSRLTAPGLALLPGSTDTVDLSKISDRKALCVDWYCYWLHNVQKTRDFDTLTAQNVFACIKPLLVQTNLCKGQPLELDLGLSGCKTLNTWPKSKPVFFVAISHGLQCVVDLCLHAWDQDDAGTWVARPLHKTPESDKMQKEAKEIKKIMQTPFRKAEYEYYPWPYAVYHTTLKDNADRRDTYIKMLEYMLQSCDFDVNRPNKLRGTEETALDIALHHRDADVVKILLSDARTKLVHKNLMPLLEMARTDQGLASLLRGRGIHNAMVIGHDPTGNDLDRLISAQDMDIESELASRHSRIIEDRDTQSLIEALEENEKFDLKKLNTILLIGVQNMNADLVRLAVNKGASDYHHNFISDFDHNKSPNPVPSQMETELKILVYVACANFHRLNQQTFKLTKHIITRIESLKFKPSQHSTYKKDGILREIVTIRNQKNTKSMSLIDWAYEAKDYFAVGQLKNMELALSSITSDDSLLALVLQGDVQSIRKTFEEFNHAVKEEIATGFTTNPNFRAAVFTAIGNYKNKKVLQALDLTALAIATYLYRFEFKIVQEILSQHDGKIKYINKSLRICTQGKNSDVTSFTITKLLAKIDNIKEKTEIQSMLENLTKKRLEEKETRKILETPSRPQQQVAF